MKKLIIYLSLLIIACSAITITSPGLQLVALRAIEQYRAGLSHKQITVTGLQVHYLEGGPKDAPSVVLVHGFGGDKDNWRRFARYLTHDYRVIALDLPGFGESDSPQGSYDVGTQAERLARIISALKVNQPHLVGNSMGGQIAALYAARHSEQLASLALFANAGINSPTRSELYQRLAAGEANPLIVRRAEDFAPRLQFVFTNVPYLPNTIKTYMGEQAAKRASHLDHVFAHLISRPVPLEPELPRISAPTLLLWGENDRVLDVSSIEVMRPLLKTPSVAIMQGVGHVPMLERPQQSADIYLAFLSSLSPEK